MAKTNYLRAFTVLVAMVMAIVAFVSVAWAQEVTQQQNPDNGVRPSAGSAPGYDDATGYRGPSKSKQPREINASAKQEATAPAKESTSPTQGATSPTLAPQQATTISGTRALGAYIRDVWLDPPTYISNFNTMVGSPAHVIMYYQNWEQADKKYFDPAKMDAAVSSGAMPMVTWASRDPTKGANQTTYADKNIVNGKFDPYIKQWADAAKAWGKPMYLRFDHEMNGNWFPWSPGANGNSTADWVNAWKHVHDIFVQEGATNVKWVWSPYINCSGCKPLSKVYPGDGYVDWVALDGYNWGTSQSGFTWQTAAQVFGPSYDTITTQVAPSKPFMIAETASAEAGGDKAKWITDTFNTDIPNRLPKTQAVVWFSSDKTAQGETDWRVDSSQSSLDSYKAVAASAPWQGQLP